MHLCGIIKPHALNDSREILRALRSASVIVLETKPLRFTNAVIETLYDHMSPQARSAIAHRLIGLTGCSLLLSVQSIERLLEIVGKESDPRCCAHGTIRARFGVHSPPAQVGTEPWWDNTFHRPVNKREAARDLLYLFGVRS